MNVRCVPIAATLTARGESGLTDAMHRHVSSCGRCRADLSDHSAVEVEMQQLRSVSYPAPPDVYHRVMDAIGPWSVPAPERTRDHRAAIAAAAAVATAAATAAAGTAVLVLRHRQRAA